MDSKEDVEQLEKLVGQLQGLYAEIGTLAKKGDCILDKPTTNA